MLSYFFEPAVLDGSDVFVKWALRRKITSSGVEVSLSPSEITDVTQKKVLREKFVVEQDRSANSDHVKSLRMSRLERRDGVVVIKVFFSGFPNTPAIFDEAPEASKVQKRKKGSR